MKIAVPLGEALTHPQARKERMESLLSAWRQHPYWLRSDGVQTWAIPQAETDLALSEVKAWQQIVRAASAVPPATHVDGLRQWATLANTRIEHLVGERFVRIEGSRASVQRLGPRARTGPSIGGFSWALRVVPLVAGVEAETCESILRKRFREVAVDGDALLAFFPVVSD